MAPDQLQIGPKLQIPSDRVLVEYSRSSGPGGQHVNKTETRVTLRFPLRDCELIPEPIKEKLLVRLANRITKAGEILIHSGRSRDRLQNFSTAWERLEAVLAAALLEDKPRKPTKVPRGVKERRLRDKAAVSRRKNDRSSRGDD